MRKKYFYAAALATMLASCSDLSEQQPEVVQPHAKAVAGETPVAFGAYTSRSISRGGQIGELTTENLSSDVINGGFGVFGYYTDANDYLGTTQPNFMYNQQVVYQAAESKWTYSPVKYWPNEYGDKASSTDEDKVTFFAYAPYVKSVDPAKGTVENATYGITGMSKNNASGDPIVKYLASFNPAQQVDLCWATATPGSTTSWATIQGDAQSFAAGMPWIDVQHPATINQDMKFYFNHALAQLNVQIDLDADVEIHDDDANADVATKVYVRSITFSGFSMKGALNLNNSSVGARTPNWGNYSGQGLLETSDIVLNDGRKDGKEGLTANASEANSNVLNTNIISNNQNTTDGVKGTAVNLFRGATEVTDPIYVIPSNGESLKVTIVYDVETTNPKLPGYLSDGSTKGTSIENKITKEIDFGGNGLVNGRKHTLKLHLGLNSVKFEAEATPWEPASADYSPWMPGQKKEGVNNPANPLSLVSDQNGTNQLGLTGANATSYIFNGIGTDKILNVGATKTNNFSILNNGVAQIAAYNPAPSRAGTRDGEDVWGNTVSNAMGVKIKALKKGSTTLTATDADGNVSTIEIMVDASELKLDVTTLRLYKFNTVTDADNGEINATIVNATYDGAVADSWPDENAFTASSEDFVTITREGNTFKFEPKAAGNTTVTFTTAQGATATATIIVANPSISMSPATVNLKGGPASNKATLTINANPAFSETLVPVITVTSKDPEDDDDVDAFTWQRDGNKITFTGNTNRLTDFLDGKIKIQYPGHTEEDETVKGEADIKVYVNDGLALTDASIDLGYVIADNGKAYANSAVCKSFHHVPVAVVVAMGDQDDAEDAYSHGLAVALSNATLTEGNLTFDSTDPLVLLDESSAKEVKTDCREVMNGKTRTLAMRSDNREHPVLAALDSYVAAPEGTSGWFIPSGGQMTLFVENVYSEMLQSPYNLLTSGNNTYLAGTIQRGVRATCSEFVFSNTYAYYITTTEANQSTVWGLSGYYGIFANPQKTANVLVRPFLTF